MEIFKSLRKLNIENSDERFSEEFTRFFKQLNPNFSDNEVLQINQLPLNQYAFVFGTLKQYHEKSEFELENPFDEWIGKCKF